MQAAASAWALTADYSALMRSLAPAGGTLIECQKLLASHGILVCCRGLTRLYSPASLLAGGTLIECQKLLATQGAAHVSAYVTHGVFPKESWRRFEGEGSNGAADGFK